MCGLFGMFNYGNEVKDLSEVTNSLALFSTARGTDAAGIAYNNKGRLIVHKEARSAEKIKFKLPDSIIGMTGHTRHATQGAVKNNYNNHPFYGSCKNLKFALSHNGIISNDDELRVRYKLPKSRIETDSFIAVQLLEYKKNLNVQSIKFMAEAVRGSFSFSILDSSDTLWLVKGDSPLSIVHFPRLKLYVYASTDEILFQALADTKLIKEVKKGYIEEVTVTEGDILSFTPDGNVNYNRFNYVEYFGYGFNWRDYSYMEEFEYGDDQLDELKGVAKYMGYSEDTIDELLENGFTPEEIEEYIYCIE